MHRFYATIAGDDNRLKSRCAHRLMEMELAAEGYRLKVSVRKIDTGNDDITVTFLGVGKRATMLVATSSAQLKARNME